MRASYWAILAASVSIFAFVQASTADRPARERGAAAHDRTESANVDKKVEGDALRISQVRGMTVRNSQGKDLGDIKDVMLDMGQGHARYAALAFGGFLGMGDKLFAIPWRALKFEHDADKNKSYAVFDVTEETLKKTPGFDKNHWPDMADRRWMDEADKRHGVDIKAGNTEVRVRTDANRETQRATKDGSFRLHRASEVEGLQVRNDHNDKLGKVEDIVVAMNSGDVRYLALSFGGFLGIGDKFFAVPFDAVRFSYDADHNDYFIAFDVTKDQLEKAPGFEKDHWPDFGNEKWAAGNDQHFTARRRNTTTGTGAKVK
jgi:sporulation protein YlmC with PRC-barrel domain